MHALKLAVNEQVGSSSSSTEDLYSEDAQYEPYPGHYLS